MDWNRLLCVDSVFSLSSDPLRMAVHDPQGSLGGEAGSLPIPRSRQACGALDEGPAGQGGPWLASLERQSLCVECFSLFPGHQLLTTSSSVLLCLIEF